MAAMEVEVPAAERSIFLCSEKDDVCLHACCGQDHKIFWHNKVFLENDSDVEDDDDSRQNPFTDIVETFMRRTNNLGSLTTELLAAAQADFEEALTNVIMENIDLNEFDEDDDDEDEEMSDFNDGDHGSDLEAEVMDRILANCVSDSSDEDEEDMFSPPAVQRQFGNFCAFDSFNDMSGEET